jgi:hypothetical protein
MYEWKEETNTYKRGTRLIEKGGEKTQTLPRLNADTR